MGRMTKCHFESFEQSKQSRAEKLYEPSCKPIITRSHHLSRKKGRASLPPHAPDQSGGKNFHLPASEQIGRKGNPADIHRTHQGKADGNSLRFSFEGRPTDIHRTHQGKADGNTPSPGTAGESQLKTDKTENRQTGNNIKT